jgi:hypothetical protein
MSSGALSLPLSPLYRQAPRGPPLWDIGLFGLYLCLDRLLALMFEYCNSALPAVLKWLLRRCGRPKFYPGRPT